MDEVSNSSNEQILKAINNFQYEMVKSMNYIREDVNGIREEVNGIRGEIQDLKIEMKDLKSELKGEINDLRQELRDYKEENNKRWEENNKLWQENRESWARYEVNRKQDRTDILDILSRYDMSISKQLGDPNVEKMRKIV